MKAPQLDALLTLAFLAGSGLLIWCLRVEPPAAGQRRRGLVARVRDVLSLLLIAVVVVLASPSTMKWEPAQWMARRSAKAKLDQAQALARQRAQESLRALEQRLASLTKASPGDGGQNPAPLLPRRDVPFPWRDMTEAEADSLNRSSVEAFDQALRYRQLLSDQTSAATHHCQYRLWRSDGGEESRPVAVVTLLPDDNLHPLNMTAAYRGWSLASDGTPLTLNLLGGEIPIGDHSVFTRVLGQFLVTAPPMRIQTVDPTGKSPSLAGDSRVAIPLKLDEPMARDTFDRVMWARVTPMSDGKFLVTLRTSAGLEHVIGRPAPIGASDEEKLGVLRSFLHAIAPATPVPAESDLGYAVRIDPGNPYDFSTPIENLTLTPLMQESDTWLRSHPDAMVQDSTVAMALKSVTRGPNALIRHATNFTSAPELVGRLRCTDAPPGQLAVLLQWLSASPAQ